MCNSACARVGGGVLRAVDARLCLAHVEESFDDGILLGGEGFVFSCSRKFWCGVLVCVALG